MLNCHMRKLKRALATRFVDLRYLRIFKSSARIQRQHFEMLMFQLVVVFTPTSLMQPTRVDRKSQKFLCSSICQPMSACKRATRL